MDDRALIHNVLTSAALSLHEATEHVRDIREVRDRTRQALHDVDGDLVEDLLVCAAAKLAAVDVDVEALVRQWGAPDLRSAGARLVEALNTISDRP